MAVRRRRLLLGAGATAGAVSVVIGLWFGVLPGVARQRIGDALRRRTGADVRVGKVNVGFSSLSLREIEILAPEGGLDVRVDLVQLETGVPLGWVGGAAAVDSVVAHGVHVRWDAARGGARDLLARMRGQGDGAPGNRRRLEIDDIDAEVRDASGTLVQVSGGTLTRDGDRLVVSAAAIDVGGETGDHVSLRGGQIVLGNADGHTAVLEIRVGGADLSWAPHRDVPDERAAALPTPWERLSSALHAIRPVGRTVTVGGTPADDADERRWLAPDAHAHVDDVAVHLRRSSGEDEIVRRLTADLDGRQDGSVHVRGSGENAEGGTVHWDLFLWPADLRAEGSLSFRALPLALVLPLFPGVPFDDPERAHLDGDLTLRGDGLTQVAFTGHLQLSEASLASPRIAPTPVRHIGATLDGSGLFVPAQRRVTIRSGRVTVGRATASTTGTIEWTSDHYLFDVDATLPPTPCGDAISAIPTDLLAELSGFSFAGTLAGHVAAHVDSRDLASTRLDLTAADACQFVTVPELADLRRFDGPFNHVVEEPDGSFFEMQTGPGSAEWTPIREISPYMLQAVLAHEDAGFFHHHGFAPSEIRVALARDLEARRYVQGASTITMQLVKNLFLRREKTLARKVQEVLLTWWIERALDKARILELYVNVIEYGPSIYGIRHAAEHYFGRTPAELTPAEAGFLAMILPNPKAFHDLYEQGALSPRMTDRIGAFLRRELSKGRIDEAAVADGVEELAHFRFHREGDPPLPAHPLVGRATALPIALDAPVEWGDESQQGGDDAQWETSPDPR